jgi:hypothetical protein
MILLIKKLDLRATSYVVFMRILIPTFLLFGILSINTQAQQFFPSGLMLRENKILLSYYKQNLPAVITQHINTINAQGGIPICKVRKKLPGFLAPKFDSLTQKYYITVNNTENKTGQRIYCTALSLFGETAAAASILFEYNCCTTGFCRRNHLYHADPQTGIWKELLAVDGIVSYIEFEPVSQCPLIKIVGNLTPEELHKPEKAQHCAVYGYYASHRHFELMGRYVVAPFTEIPALYVRSEQIVVVNETDSAWLATGPDHGNDTLAIRIQKLTQRQIGFCFSEFEDWNFSAFALAPDFPHACKGTAAAWQYGWVSKKHSVLKP